MKIVKFNKYKRLVESQEIKLLHGSDEAIKIYQWMEASGRIDEGFWGSIWSWMKRNFSPTSMKLHKLADEFGDEFSKELKAEFDRKEDSKDKAAQMRSSWAGRLSGDIEERMRIIAEDDPDYQDLVRYLINKKTLEAKRANLKYLDDDDQKIVDKELRIKEKNLDEEKNKVYSSLMKDEKRKMEEIRKQMRDESKKHIKILSLSFNSEKSREAFIILLCNYSYLMSRKFDKDFDFKTTKKYLEEIVNFVSKDGISLRTGTISPEESMEAVLNEIEILLDDSSGIDLPRLLRKALSNAKSELETTNNNGITKKVTTSYTSKIMNDDDIESSIEHASDETGKGKPSKYDIIEEIKKSVSDHFSDSNIEIFADQINEKIQEFNNLSEDERKERMKKYSYSLSSDLKLKNATTDDIKLIITAFIDMVGLIYPYFTHEDSNENTKQAIKITSRFLFEIYAIEKDPSKKLMPDEKAKLLKNMKEKYNL